MEYEKWRSDTLIVVNRLLFYLFLNRNRFLVNRCSPTSAIATVIHFWVFLFLINYRMQLLLSNYSLQSIIELTWTSLSSCPSLSCTCDRSCPPLLVMDCLSSYPSPWNTTNTFTYWRTVHLLDWLLNASGSWLWCWQHCIVVIYSGRSAMPSGSSCLWYTIIYTPKYVGHSH